MNVILELPDVLRAELKEPMGDVYTDAERLLAAAGEPVIAVGDMVTYHLIRVDDRPDVALVDGKTEREAVETEVLKAVEGFDRTVQVENPPATLSDDLLRELRAAVERDGTTVVEVVGEEDLAALPAALVAPDGAAVVYGQPGEGMVLGVVDDDLRARMRDLLDRMDGDPGRAYELLGVDG